MGERNTAVVRAFGEALYELRAEKGMTQEELALEAGTERSHVSALERAEKGPSLATVLSLAKALGIPAGELVSRTEEKLRATRR